MLETTLQQLAEQAREHLWEGDLSYNEAQWLVDHGFHVDPSNPTLASVGNIRRCRVYTN